MRQKRTHFLTPSGHRFSQNIFYQDELFLQANDLVLSCAFCGLEFLPVGIKKLQAIVRIRDLKFTIQTLYLFSIKDIRRSQRLRMYSRFRLNQAQPSLWCRNDRNRFRYSNDIRAQCRLPAM